MDIIHFLRLIKYARDRGSRWSDVRYYRRWERSMAPGANSMDQRLAWVSFPALDRLQGLLKPTDRVFEYGAGGSTLFWLDRVAEVVSVEHDRLWFADLEQRIKKESGSRWTGILVPPTPGDLVAEPDPAEPTHYASADVPSKHFNYKAYVHAIDRFPDAYFDVLMIDGRARTSCLAYATAKLKPGGLLVLDNAERTYYTERNGAVLRGFTVLLSGMAPVIFSQDLSETRILRKK